MLVLALSMSSFRDRFLSHSLILGLVDFMPKVPRKEADKKRKRVNKRGRRWHRHTGDAMSIATRVSHQEDTPQYVHVIYRF